MVFIFHQNEGYLSYKPKCKVRNTIAGSNSTPFQGEIEKWRNNCARPIVLVLKMILVKFGTR